jgi:hypothetical protein
MTVTNVARKRRVMHNAIVLDTANVPAFPSGPNADGVMKFAGDFAGAHILGMEWVISGTFDLTTINGKLQHSDDGVLWHDVDATSLSFTQLAANGSEYIPVLDQSAETLKRFLRFALTAGAAGTTTNIELAIYYQQIRAPGHLAYAGMVDRHE